MFNFTESHLINNNRNKEEIAHPNKFLQLFEYDKNNWQSYKNVFYIAQLENCYILVDNIQFINDFEYINVEEWLNKYWNKLILITSNNTTTFDKNICDKNYTIANGLTLILALHRLNILNANCIYPTLNNFVATKTSQPFQQVTEIWNEFYYNTNNIADFPFLYLCMGPNWADIKILNLFKIENMYPFVQSYENNSYIFTSAFTAMFPHFNINHWKYHSNNSNWLDFNLYTNIIVFPNIHEFVFGITRNKRSLRWFLNNSDYFVATIIKAYNSSKEGWCIIFTIFNALYNEPNLFNNKARLRKIWKPFILKSSYLDKFIFLSLTEIFPMILSVPFMLDVFNYKLDLYQQRKFVLRKKHIPLNINVSIYSDEFNIINTSFIALLKKSDNLVVKQYYKKYVEKKVATKLFAISSLPNPIDVIMKDFYNNNKNLLID